MAGMIGTNIAPDGSAEFRFVQNFLNFLEEKDLANDRTLQARMTRIVANHLASGHDAVYKLVDKRHIESFEKELIRQNIPFTKIYDTQGQPAIVVRDCDQEAFMQIQKNIFSLDTRMNAQLGVEDLCKNCQEMGMKNMIKLSFDNEADFYEAQTKAYQMGFVTGAMNGDLYIAAVDVLNQKGEDLAAFELTWAINQSMNDPMFGGDPTSENGESPFQKLRTAQAEYDMQQIKDFSKSLQGKREPVIMLDASGRGKNALEVGEEGLTIHRIASNGRRVSEVLVTKEDLAYMDADQIGAVIAKHGFDIRNKVLVPAADRDKVLDTKSEDIRKYVSDYTRTNRIETRPRNAEYGIDGDKEDILKFKKQSLEPMMTEVQKEARKLAKADRRYSPRANKCIENEALVKEYTALLLKEKKLACINNFLSKEGAPLTKEERSEWLNNIAGHLTNTKEKCRHELSVEATPVKDVKKQITQIKEQIISKEKSKAQEYAKSSDAERDFD